MTLVEFLLARIAEDEAVVPKLHDGAHGNTVHGWYGKREPVSRREIAYGQTAARVLAECDAKRRIVERFEWVDSRPGYEDIMEAAVGGDDARATLLDLALPYVDHPDYRAKVLGAGGDS